VVVLVFLEDPSLRDPTLTGSLDHWNYLAMADDPFSLESRVLPPFG
jgi:hypothetical protein